MPDAIRDLRSGLPSGLCPAVAWWAGTDRPLPRYGHQAAAIGTVILLILLITVTIAAIHFIRRRH